MKILITGAGGQVGTELVRAASPAGHEVIGMTHAALDIADARAVIEVVESGNPDVVVNAAAYTAVDKAESDAQTAFAVNRDGPANLAATCAETGARLIQISTDYVFDGSQSAPYAEDDPTEPASVYGRSKLAGEDAIRAALPEHIIIRAGWIFGAYGHNFVKTMLRLGAERDDLGVVADQRGGPTPAADLANALVSVVSSLGRSSSWGTYHYQGKPETTWHGFAEAIFSRAVEKGLLARAPEVGRLTTAEYPLPAPRPANGVLDCSKWHDTFGIALPDWRDGLGHVLDDIAASANAAPETANG